MTDTAAPIPSGATSGMVRAAPVLFAVTVFTSAALVFLVEPMIAKLVLPTLGGSPAVWNTCMAFFQAGLLVGYAYAHLLQKISSVKRQAMVHAAVLFIAALALPLRVTELFGEPSSSYPGLWLFGVLAVSLGAPFAALSATAPLVQAWYAKVRAGHADAANPYVLYAASNLGSLIALLAYPIAVEPSLRLSTQAWTWTAGYAAFVALMLIVAVTAARTGDQPQAAAEPEVRATVSWRQRLWWIGLSAAPSSLMLGVTTHITTDIASAPFLWVAPLALYLLTFIIAFSGRPIIPRSWALVLQAAAMVGVIWSLGLRPQSVLLMLAVHLIGFFLTALVCHQRLADSRPHPSRLTEFYLWLSVGGVVGGAFNAFLAPALFSGVWEYPIVLVLACLARPWGQGRLTQMQIALTAVGLISVVFSVGIMMLWGAGIITTPTDGTAAAWLRQVPPMIFAMAPVCAFLVRDRAALFTLLVFALAAGSHNLEIKENVLAQDRSFFGVMKVTKSWIPGYAQDLRLLTHGTTLHGAQAMDAANPCLPLTYYAPATPIGQVILSAGKRKRNMVLGAVGMGTGSVAAYARPDDEYRFYEIDPLVVAMARNPNYFTYISKCAQSPRLDWRIGDARLTLAKEKSGAFDVLLVDAFSSDAVPAHLLTVEAMRLYLDKINDDGVVIMHLSNRHLDLLRPVAATAKAAGGVALEQAFNPTTQYDLVESAENVIIVGKSRAALETYWDDHRWQIPAVDGVKPWTDDYTNLFSALVRDLRDKMAARAASRQ